MRIFVAGAAGAMGRQLVPMLVAAGHEVTGTTRSLDRAGWLTDAGASPALLDALDADAVRAALRVARPEVVINQLTDLSRGFDADDLVATGRLRRVGTRALVDGALEVGARRVVSQSGAWLYAEGPVPHTEADALRTPTDRPQDASLRGILELEPMTLDTAGLEGVVLRYGYFYGPGTSYPTADDAPRPRVAVEDAARATALALTATAGIYNVLDDDPDVSNVRAREVLGWEPSVSQAA